MISYDRVATLADASHELGVTFDLLSDENSHLITELGLLNRVIEAQHAADDVEHDSEYEGAAHPGLFVLDRRGVVIQRHFEGDYRIRPDGEVVLGMLELEDAPRPETTRVSITVSVDSAAQASGQAFVRVGVEIAPGWHVYGPDAPSPYTPLSVGVEPVTPGVRVGPVQLPPAEPIPDPVAGEPLPAYKGSVRVSVPVTLAEHAGTSVLHILVNYQACSQSVCDPPRRVTRRLVMPDHGV